MKKNIFSMFLDKVFNVPLWVKQVMYIYISEYMREKECEEYLNCNVDDIFAVYVPIITFKGKTESTERACGLDNNLYNFLECCLKGYNMVEISVNLFLSMEETTKFLELCIEQNFIKRPQSAEIIAMLGYISGRLRLGEYFKQRGTITVDQLHTVLVKLKEHPNKQTGEILLELGYVKEKDLKALLILKEESKKRFIVDYNTIPRPDTEYANDEQRFEEAITKLKKENLLLKRKLLALLDMVKKDAGMPNA